MEKTCSQSVVLICFINWFLATCCSATISTFSDDHSALLAFRAHITSDPQNILAKNWSTNTSPCKWIGVSCGIRHQRVTALNISNMGLEGTISPYLGNVSFLTTLDLSSNSFYGFLPKELAHLRRLKQLYLQTNNFAGGIPRVIGNLTMLKEIHLGGNNWKGEIPLEFANLKHLEQLNISYGSLVGPIPSFIFNMSSLKEINLRNNSLSGSCFHDEIHYNVPVLERLILSYNNLSGDMSTKIGNFSSLKALHLKHNVLTGTLPSEIESLKLEEFGISENSLTGLIPLKIFNNSRLRILSMQSNNFSGHLPSSMGLSLPNLNAIYLNNNIFGGKIPTSISNASMLTLLQMDNNLFTGSIPSTLGNLRLLKCLHLSNNKLTTESSSKELGFFTSLTNSRKLERLSIGNNQFNGILPASIGNLSSSLLYFYASGSKIKGHIPDGIGNLSSLQIELSENELTGSIPTTIGRLKTLQFLNLSSNRLQGSIPNEFCILKNLGDLDLSKNMLYGSIPSCLGELKSLRNLKLKSNNLTSTIPSTLQNLIDLLTVDLSFNSLSGNVPSYIGNMKVLTYLDLSWNNLSGDIPSTVGNAQVLIYLFLQHNKLEGSIPESFGNLKGLELLDMSNNNFSGVIPKSLETLRYLKDLNLSFNMLEGEIPSGGPFANLTAQSFIGNIGLCGASRLLVPACTFKTHGKSRLKIGTSLKYILPLILSVVVVGGAIIYLLIGFCKGGTKNQPLSSYLSFFAQKRISYYELVRATKSFSESNLLGVGSFGSVFKGTLSDGIDVAVKVFNLQLAEAIKSFDIECQILCNVRHRNLARIISSCSNLDFKALVLEYIPNGSLEKLLYSHYCCLDIFQRLNIMIDVASALEYLHHGHHTQIVHCDLKPTNILIDEDMTGHVCDFGISKLLGEDEFIAQTKTLATIGYMAPEYGLEGIVSTKGDVYSYGILLMETFTRKKPTDEMFSGDMTMRSWVNEALQGPLLQVVDSNLLETKGENLSAEEQCLSSILSLALECSRDSPIDRITMEEVVVRLHKIKLIMLQAISGSVL